MKISVVIPVYNEEALIGNALAVLREIKKQGFNCEVLICDNASTDKTGEIAKKLQKKQKSVKYFRTEKKGIGHGIMLGYEKASNDICVTYAIDDPYEKSFFKKVIQMAAEEKADLVLGSKPESSKRSFLRKTFSNIYNSIVRLMFNSTIADYNGIITFKKKKIKNTIRQVESRDTFFATELILRALKAKLKVKEAPVKISNTRKTSKINPVLDGVKMFFKLIKLRFEI